MNEELKSAIRTIAEYDGVTIREDDSFWNDSDKYGHWMHIKHLPYTKSADALLPVWRKVGDDMNNQVTITGHYKVREAGSMILNNKLPEACLKLAEIISQLKEQK